MDEKNYNTGSGYAARPSDAPQCCCMRCRGRGLMAPAVLVTLGILFMLSEFGVAHFDRTWPILLIVIGLVRVLGGNLDNTGHIEATAPAPPGTSPAPPQNPQQREGDHV